MILDDPISGLDTATENHIWHSLMGKSGIWRKMQVTVLMTSSSGMLTLLNINVSRTNGIQSSVFHTRIISL